MISTKDIPTVTALIPPTVHALKALGGSASNQEIHDEVIKQQKYSEDIVEAPHDETSTITKLEYRLKWARSYLKKIDAINNATQGVWTLTPSGYALSDIELEDVARRVRAINRAARKEASSVGANVSEDAEEDETTAELDWKEILLASLLRMPPEAFERLCQRLLREAGFTRVEVTGRSGDGGIDGHGILRVNLVSFQVLFQSKRWAGSVGAGVVRDFRGAMMGRADKGLIITTSRFTADARNEATRDGAPAIDLIDGEDLCDLLKDHRIGTRVELVEQVQVDAEYLENF